MCVTSNNALGYRYQVILMILSNDSGFVQLAKTLNKFQL